MKFRLDSLHTARYRYGPFHALECQNDCAIFPVGPIG